MAERKHQTWSKDAEVDGLVKKLKHSPFGISFVQVVTTPIIGWNKKNSTFYSIETNNHDIFDEDLVDGSISRVAVLRDICITTNNPALKYQPSRKNCEDRDEIYPYPLMKMLQKYMRQNGIYLKDEKNLVRVIYNHNSPNDVLLRDLTRDYEIGKAVCFKPREHLKLELVQDYPQIIKQFPSHKRDMHQETTLLERQRVILFPSKTLAIAYKEYRKEDEKQSLKDLKDICDSSHTSNMFDRFYVKVNEHRGTPEHECIFAEGYYGIIGPVKVLEPIFLHSLDLKVENYRWCVDEYKRKFKIR